jgi:iron complex outermembrane receptor protein
MLLALALFVVAAGPADAGTSLPDDGQLEELLDTEIETDIGRVHQRTADVAGALTVLRGEELRQRGYTSLAQALTLVPGLYQTSDLTTVNLGVRGIIGGAGSAGNLIKVLIDGNPVSFVPTNGNFFGEELIPLEVVERIEVLRSPSSALFGANAFLGVVNIVTRSGDMLRTGALLSGGVGTNRGRLELGGAVVASGSTEGFEALAAFQQYRFDRSGLALPSSSPALQRQGAAPGAAVSQNDVSNPQSIFARLRLSNVAGGQLSAVFTQQRLDASNQFAGFAPLRAASHLTLLNQGLRVEDQRAIGERVDLRTGAEVHRSTWEPSSVNDLGNDGEVAQAAGGAIGFGVSSTASIRLAQTAWLTVGADFTRDQHEILRYGLLRTSPLIRSDGSVALPAGTLIENDPFQSKLLWNLGGLAQGVVKLGSLVTLNAGVRVDGHNIYGLQVSPRAGVVVGAPEVPWSVKLLFNSAFKAPSAVELYGRPLTSFDLTGNASLKPQYTRSFELLGTWRRPLLWSVQLSTFATWADQLVTYVQTTKYFEASNGPGRWFVGGELEAEWTPLRELTVRGNASLAVAVSRPALASDPFDSPLPIAPSIMGHAIIDYSLPFLRGLLVSAQLTVVGPRQSSEANAIERYQRYTLPTYGVLSVNAALMDQRWLGARRTSLRVRVDNVLDTRFVDAGYGGVDLPSLGRTLFFSVTQEL